MTGIVPNSTLRETGGARITTWQLDRHLIEAAHSELRHWGRWNEAHQDYTGYPSRNILAGHEGCGGLISGHRVLCLDRPEEVWQTEIKVNRLPIFLQDIVFVTYCVTVKGDGTLWKSAEKAIRLGLSESTFWRWLKNAKLTVGGMDLLDVDFDSGNRYIPLACKAVTA